MSDEKKGHDSGAQSEPSTTDGSVQHFEAMYDETTIDSAYLFKAQVLNDAIQKIGMGKYQW